MSLEISEQRLHFIVPRDGPEGIEGLNTPLADSPLFPKNEGNSLSFPLSLSTRGSCGADGRFILFHARARALSHFHAE